MKAAFPLAIISPPTPGDRGVEANRLPRIKFALPELNTWPVSPAGYSIRTTTA
jgi:hypothetical protein